MERTFLPKSCIRIIILCYLVFTLPACNLSFLGIQHDLDLHSLKRMFLFLIGTLLALILGIATHLIWDGLTHSDFRTFIFKDVLATTVHLLGHPYPLHRLLQLGSSALALPFIVWMCVHYYQRYKQH